jgi:DNA-binding transcriptional regulator PaaX
LLSLANVVYGNILFMTNRMGNLKKKIILLLAAGVTLGASRTIGKQIKIFQEVSKEWKVINRDSLKRSLTSLYSAKLISLRPKGDTFEIILSQDGKKMLAKFNLDEIKIKRLSTWDRRWRIVLFDIPENLKKVRDAIRFHFKKIGLIEYQKSVFISPYPCEKEIKFIAEFYRSHKYIRIITAISIDNELAVKKYFKIT